MKKRFLILFVLVLMFSGLTVSAKSSRNQFEIDFGKDLTVAYNYDDLSQISGIVNMSKDELSDYFEKNGVLALAVNSDNSLQMRICAYKNDLSELVKDISLLDEEEQNNLAKQLSDSNGSYKTVKNNNRVFFMIDEFHKDSGGEYNVVQYITVADDAVYQFSGYYTDVSGLQKIENAFDSLKINAGVYAAKKSPLWEWLLIGFGIAAFSALAVAMLIGIFRDKKRK